MKDRIRQLFKIPILEKLLINYTNDKVYGSGLTKLTPNHFNYKSPAIRKVKRNGVNFQLDLANIVDWNIYFGFYEISREKLFRLHPDPKVILDVGANIGEISLRFAQSYPSAKIHGFEPFRETFCALKQNVSLNAFPNIELYQLGLGSNQGKVFFEERTIGNPGMNRVTFDSDKSTREIEITTLDLIIQNQDIKTISLIKIDVEGYEMEVLKGAEALIQEYHPIFFIELDDENLKEQGSNALELIQFLIAHGYKIRHAETNEVLTCESDFNNCHFDIISEI